MSGDGPLARDPEECPKGHPDSSVINSRIHRGQFAYRCRRHRCKICGARWNSYQSLINPQKVKVTYNGLYVGTQTDHF